MDKHWSLLDIELVDNMEDYTGKTWLLHSYESISCGILSLILKCENKLQKALCFPRNDISQICRTHIIFPRPKSSFL